ncbi:hypothetical protein [Streptomyces sp. NBC_01306]|uniref:hypothetical protein n=1 Tax=Streptomyces sp. NBC_01306 TaxID=2903819 RepID=UPI00225AF133|nr:hypothetical protein [Streptomyces sp. NBC_01306]MCX4729199.1 hypothetical protein [Streptomyces sp. NBC_01306]
MRSTRPLHDHRLRLAVDRDLFAVAARHGLVRAVPPGSGYRVLAPKVPCTRHLAKPST